MDADKLAKQFTPLARSITRRVLRETPLAHRDEVYSDALLGLAKAIDKLDESRPVGMQVRFIEQKIWTECFHGRRSRARGDRRNGYAGEIPDVEVIDPIGDQLDSECVLRCLPVSEQEVIVLCGAGFSQDETARILGVSQMTVSRRLRQARKQLERETK